MKILINKCSAEDLEDVIRICNKQYWEWGYAFVSDLDYDQMVNRLKSLKPDSPLVEMKERQNGPQKSL